MKDEGGMSVRGRVTDLARRCRRRSAAAVAVVGTVLPALLASGLAGAAPGTAGGGAVDSVVVFPDRARVTRVASTRCENGMARARFERLPVSLDARTLRGEVREPAELIGVTSETINEEQAAEPRARELTAELHKVQAEIRDKEARQNATAAELEDLTAFAGVLGATVAEEMRNPNPATAVWSKSIDGLVGRRAALDDRRRKLAAALRALRREEDRVRRELGALQAGADQAPRATRAATVAIGCRTLGQVTASLSYVVPGATWQPEYDLDFSPRTRGSKVGAGTARLTVGAVVRQTTGEDWRGVHLSVSTARPKLGAEAPRPAPLLVDGTEQKREKVLIQAQERREQIETGRGTSDGSPAAASATVDDKGNAFVLTLPHRVNVLADGRPVWAPVDVAETQASAKLVTVPKLDEHVYQVVTLKNPAAYPLLEGRMRSYRAGSYVGDATTRYRGVGEPMEVSLGIDGELKVERKLVDDRAKDAALLSSTKRLTRTVRIVVKNQAASAETVEVRENIPVSQIDDVKVEVVGKQTTSGYNLDAPRGFVTWSLALKSGEEKSVDLAYVVALPESWQVGAAW